MRHCQTIWLWYLTSRTKCLTKKSLLSLLLTPPPKDLEAQECVRSSIAKIAKELLSDAASTLKRYQKTSVPKQLSAIAGVGGVVTAQEPMVSPEVELMRKPILADYERDVFRWEDCLGLGQEHPEVCVMEQLGFAKLDVAEC